MFFNFKAAHFDVVKENKELRDKLEVAERRLAAYELARIHTSNCEPVIDFDKLRVFSIERNRSHDDRDITVLGYYLAEPVISSDGEMIVMRDVVHEWSLYCNEERHAELVQRFKKFKGIDRPVVGASPQPYVHSKV